MKKIVKAYIRSWYPGSFVSEDSVQEVPYPHEKNPLYIPERAYAFQHFERDCVIDDDGSELLGKPKNHTKTYYIGTELTGEQAIAENPGNSILRGNIEGNGYKRLVKTKYGQLLPLGENDVVLTQSEGAPKP